MYLEKNRLICFMFVFQDTLCEMIFMRSAPLISKSQNVKMHRWRANVCAHFNIYSIYLAV